MEADPDYETCLYKQLRETHAFFKSLDKRPEFLQHLDKIMYQFKKIERRVLLLRVAERNQDLLYRGFCEYEQLKIFMDMNLDYINPIFSMPLSKYKRLLGQIQAKMQAADDDDSTGLILE